MKNERIKITAALLVATFALSGCGEALYELTSEEEAAIVSYASHTVAKFNTFQQDGEIFVMQEILDGEDEEPEANSATIQETEQQMETGEEASASTDVQDMAEAPPQTVSIGEALDLGGILVTYKGNSLCTTYEKSDIVAVDAEAGEQFLVLDIELANQSDQNQQIDLLSMKPIFQAVINETQTSVAQTTILPNDLSTYQGDIAAGSASDTVLIFQIPEDIQEISSIQLKITVNGSQHTINL